MKIFFNWIASMWNYALDWLALRVWKRIDKNRQRKAASVARKKRKPKAEDKHTKKRRKMAQASQRINRERGRK